MNTMTTERTVLYPNAPWYFALAVLVTWLGFSFSYFARLAQTDIFHHLHGASAGLWMTLLIVQPILYKRGHLAWHRRLAIDGFKSTFTETPSDGRIILNLLTPYIIHQQIPLRFQVG